VTTPKRKAYRAIFPTTITPSTIERRSATNGTPYLFMRDAEVEQKDGSTRRRTVMAFRRDAAELAQIEAKMQPGVPVRMAVQYDQGTQKIIGDPRDEAQAA
jgi:hypothetical protein